MSTMELDTQTFLDLAKTLSGYDYTANGSKYQHVGLAEFGGRNTYVRLGFGTTYNKNNRDYDGVLRLMGYLYMLNHRAVYRFYHTRHDIDRYEKFPRSLERYAKEMPIAQVLKSLECIKYNIDTEYPLLDELVNKVRCALVGELPEYNAAIWG